MRMVLPIVYFRRSIAAQEKFAQKVKECLMARTLDLIRGYMFSHRMEPRGAGTGSDPVLKTKNTKIRDNQTQNRRSFALIAGRFWIRFRMPSSCRKARFSRAKLHRLLSDVLKKQNSKDSISL